ncbi:Glycosyl transferase family 2 [Chryseobacterium rhizoplanae]|uniref:Glycosyl transferase family 2 n=1 Tax=Chryseobacterium rhizoplanae TaxID=1609531 RepID=A0A521DNN6_9FLAO|nr:glycosyltransferase family 2 protein [Chryseobacterium rhizoplanae]SMO72560.1 Glycosyl transferase family 2 [Chryseobacterium rhizoplanae]
MKISVIISVYNAEEFVANAVRSALQFEEVCEVFLIEYGSSDHSLTICEKLEEDYDRIKLFQHNQCRNKGNITSRNLGIENASGDFISFLDASNYYLPNRFDAERELLKNQKVDGVYGAVGIHYYSQRAKEKYYHLYKDCLIPCCKKCHPKTFIPRRLNKADLFDQFSIDTLTVRKDRLLEKMHYLFTSYSMQGDVEFLLSLSYYLELYYGILHEPVAMQGVHDSCKVLWISNKEVLSAITE